MKKIIAVFTALLLVFLFADGQANGQNSATLVVYRDGFIYGSWKDFVVKVDGKKIGELKDNKSLFTYQISPGRHRISPDNVEKSLGININAGQTYVVEFRVRFSFPRAVPKLDIKSIGQAKKDSKLVRQYFSEHGQ